MFMFLCLIVACSDNPSLQENGQNLNGTTKGSGYFDFNADVHLGEKTIRVYYHIPQNVTQDSEFLFVFHGNGRNAFDYRKAMISKSEQYNFIVIVPRFSSQDFPGGDKYNLGNIFEDGDNPTPETLNLETDWTFSLIEPIFNYVKTAIDNSSNSYNLFGHSAGGQFVHRFLMFKPDAHVNKTVASASGWYTVTNLDIDFPYGFKESPLLNISLEQLFNKRLIIQVGELDNDPNAAGLRHNQFADAQGLHRLERAQHFFNQASQLALDNNFYLNWDLMIIDELAHDYEGACAYGADLIFNP
jgi:pimeloyl-ACP methyl ester carboxylesterase